MNEPVHDNIEVRETIDGEPIKRATRQRTRAASSAKSAPAGGKQMSGVRRADPYLWGIYLMLLMISVIELFSASSTEVKLTNVYYPLIRHGIFLAMGLGIVLWLQRTPYVIISRFSWLFGILSLGLLLLSMVMGVEINGAQRAIKLAGMTIQPAEIVKLSVVCLLACILGRNQRPGGVTTKGVILAAVVVVVFSACLYKNGMTNMLLLMCVSLAMMLIGGIPLKKIAYVLLAYAIGAGGVYMIRSSGASHSSDFDALKQEQQMLASADQSITTSIPHKKPDIDRRKTRLNRIKNFFRGVHPNDSITDENRQVFYAKISQANSKIIGLGPGNSRESARLPLAYSDYIYSIIVEDTGLAGGIAVLLLFILLLTRAGRIAFKCSRALPAFLIMGCAVMIVFQALVHMAIVTGVFPVSGQPLPFISKGGTSILVMSAALGIMLSVSRYASYTTDGKAVAEELDALPEDMQNANFSSNISK